MYNLIYYPFQSVAAGYVSGPRRMGVFMMCIRVYGESPGYHIPCASFRGFLRRDPKSVPRSSEVK